MYPTLCDFLIYLTKYQGTENEDSKCLQTHATHFMSTLYHHTYAGSILALGHSEGLKS